MRLRTEAIITVVAVSLVIFLLLHFVAVLVIMPGFKNVDIQDNNENLRQATSTINYRIAQLERSTRDYAWWDDTYYYAQNHNEQYITANFVSSTFENLNLNLAAIFDSRGDLIYLQTFEGTNQVSPLEEENTRQLLLSNFNNWSLPSDDSTHSGMLTLNDKPMMLAITDILTSQNQGPAAGKMIFGTYLDQDELSSLQEINNLDFSIQSLTNLEGNSHIVEPLLSNPQDSIIIENNEKSLSGYIIVNDINSNPEFILQVNGQRTAYQQGIWVENLFLACSICIAITFGAATLSILERRIIKPMSKLAAAVQDLPFEPQAIENRHAGNHEIIILSNAVRSTLNKRMDAMLEVSRMVAHDLRNPLSGIRNANYVLKKNYSCYLDSKGNLMLTTIDDCVDYSDKIVKDLLDYSTQLKLSKILTPLQTLINKSLQTIVVPQNITVITETKEQLALYVDPEKLQRVFSNLIKNAIDAMSNQGTLTIKSKRVGENVVIEFSDNGVGMSEETLKKLWQPFFTTKAKGMGVGLAICKKIIEAHEGTLEAKSVLNKGTTFKVSLPLKLESGN